MKQITKYILVFIVLILSTQVIYIKALKESDKPNATSSTKCTNYITEEIAQTEITMTQNTTVSIEALLLTATTIQNYEYTDKDIQLIEKVVEGEVGNCSESSKIAVTNIILNRLKSNKFPNLIEKVVYQNNPVQFAAVHKQVVASDNTKQAVQKAINGDDNSKGALYYYAPKYVHNRKTIRWFESLEFLFELDGQRYFK